LTFGCVFLTAPSKYTRDNEKHENYETRHLPHFTSIAPDPQLFALRIVILTPRMVCPQVIQRFHIGRLPPDQMGLRKWTAFRSLSPMTMLHNLRSYCRLLALVASWLLSVFPLPSAHNSKELMADACSNELHQREQNVLWASHVERRTTGTCLPRREN
jgi:hypothetical protein